METCWYIHAVDDGLLLLILVDCDCDGRAGTEDEWRATRPFLALPRVTMLDSVKPAARPGPVPSCMSLPRTPCLNIPQGTLKSHPNRPFSECFL